MKKHSFSLRPFDKSAFEQVTIQGEISRRKGMLTLGCALSGGLSDILVPETAVTPERLDRLWQETCFEFFIAPKGRAYYWEFNLSPSGHWNVYRFTSYREGVRTENTIDSLPFIVRRREHNLEVSAEVSLDAFVHEDQTIEISVCAVTMHRDGTMSYWALTHPGHVPDFHHRDGFIIQL